ncbi:DUF2158 domain-containing protein [Altererythrobacter sp. MTPC7]|uniref:DUF2158 domain-containing protein n=1 Tax=Altererythrobacter sp. MTPC7 TaxID=3056567 RepID=UPI0036F1AE6F
MGVRNLANAFKKGDIVALKSGGVPMTVDLCPFDDGPRTSHQKHLYRCVWQKGANPEFEYYGEHVLKTYEPPKK